MNTTKIEGFSSNQDLIASEIKALSATIKQFEESGEPTDENLGMYHEMMDRLAMITAEAFYVIRHFDRRTGKVLHCAAYGASRRIYCKAYYQFSITLATAGAIRIGIPVPGGNTFLKLQGKEPVTLHTVTGQGAHQERQEVTFQVFADREQAEAWAAANS